MAERVFSILLITLLLGACAARAPEAIRSAPPGDLSVKEAQAEPERFLGTPLRWGGRIIRLHNRADETLIELLALPLDKSGQPVEAAAGWYGRFLIRIERFIDPLVYEEGRLLTVAGKLAGIEARHIGEFEYRYPVVEAGTLHLWPRPEPATPWAPVYEPWPWYHDPWFHPHPWHPYH